MPKGRRFVPPTATDGVWFTHRGLPEMGPPQRRMHTSTGFMLSAPFDEPTRSYPPVPPQPYSQKEAINFKDSNNFSAHDNRHSFQDHGVYLGDGRNTRSLGKRNRQPEARQHFTDKEYLKHYGRQVVDHDYNSIYSADYTGRKCKGPPVHRRFPRIHSDGEPGCVERLSTATTSWFKEPEVPYKTPLQVLASSQEPFLPDNKWKYSFHGLSKCYPAYDHVDHQNPYPLWRIRGRGQEQNA